MGGCIQPIKKDEVGGAGVETIIANGISGLHIAAADGNLEEIKYCISKGLEVDAKDFDGSTPLITAGFAKKNFLKIVDLLLENGADIQAVNREGNDVLFIAAWKGRSLKDLRGLISRGVNWKRTNVDGETILHMAARGGNVEAVRFFISNGADVGARDLEQFTPLLASASAERNFLATVDILLKHGARINERNREGNNLIYLATSQQRPVKDLEALIKRGGNWETATNDQRNTLMHIAASNGDLEGVSYFIVKGADVNDKNLKGETPLMHATLADTNFTKIVELLVTNGADVSATDENAYTAAFWAVLQGKCGEELELLIGRETDGDTWDRNDCFGRSLAHMAVSAENLEALKCILKKNAELDRRDLDGWTPLMLAVALENVSMDVVDFLIEIGANVNVVDNGGYGIIALAIIVGRNVEDLKHLVSRGLPMYIRNRNRFASCNLHFAALKGDPDILKYFISNWSHVDVRNNLGETPLLVAVQYRKRNLTAVNILVEADINVVDNRLTHATLWAVKVDRPEVDVRKLVETGCCWWTPNKFGETIFQTVTEKGDFELLSYFLTLRSKSADEFIM